MGLAELMGALEGIYPLVQSRLLEPLKGNPVDILVAAILSQNTGDNLSLRAFQNLKNRFASWEDLLCSEESEVEKEISVCGLQRQKARSIRAAFAAIQRDFGELSLESLCSAAPEEAFDYLTSLTGVGPKTAACVQVFGLGQPAFPVDTHVLRVSKRLGLVPQTASAAQAQMELEKRVSDHMKLPLHLLMIEHGRQLCKASNPGCSRCPLAGSCYLRNPKKDSGSS